jgi:hypothetical protein
MMLPGLLGPILDGKRCSIAVVVEREVVWDYFFNKNL